MMPLLGSLLESSLRISVVAGVVGLFLALARVRSSELRHKAWAAVLTAMLLMPALPKLVPPLRVPVEVNAELPRFALPAAPAEPAPIPQSARAPQSNSPVAQEMNLTNFAAPIYAAVLLAMLARLLVGWIAVRRLMRASRRVEGEGVFESDSIATPLTVGILRPAVLLPAEWRQWPAEKLSAVLAHELAHVTRRDTLTSFVAHVNRCVFWFHPLAWWLERHLATVAEQACDDAGIRAVGESRRYAEVLLDIAQTAARAGRRISWQGVGVDGAGLLGARIDRVLRGGALLVRVTRRQKWVVAAACVAAIAVAAACQQTKPVQALKPAQKGLDELHTHIQLAVQYRDRKDQQELAAVHEIWLAEHHPEEESAWAWGKLLPTAPLERMKQIWGAWGDREDAPGRAAANAGLFFQWQVNDPARAAAIFEKLHARDRNPEWARMLGSLYGRVVLGQKSPPQLVAEVRAKLSESQDAPVLAAAGLFIEERLAWPREANREAAQMADDYVGRAAKIDPQWADVRYAMNIRRRTEHDAKMRQALPGVDNIVGIDQVYAQLRKLSEAEQFAYLPDLVERAYSQGETSDHDHDEANGARYMKLAQTYASRLLEMCPVHSGEPGYALALHRANMVLAGTSIRLNGDKTAALKYLAAAASVPQPGSYFVSPRRVLHLMLQQGGSEARAVVIEYCERESKLLGPGDESGLAKLADQLRKG